MADLRLFDASPAWTIEEDTLIGFDLSFTQGATLTGLDPSCETDAALEDTSARLNEVLCSVPEGAIVRLYSVEIGDYADLLHDFQAQFDPNDIGGYVARKKVEQCAGRIAPRRRELFCFVSTPPALPLGGGPTPALLGRRAAKMLARARELHADRVQQATRLMKTVSRALGSAGLGVEPLSGDELFSVVWRLANPLRSRSLGAPVYRRDHLLRPQLFGSGLQNELDRFRREGALNRVATMKLPPKHLVPTQILELQGLPFRHTLAVTLRRVSDQEALRRVETNRRQGHELDKVLAKFRGADRHAAMPDHALLQQQHDVNDVLARLTEGERLFDVAVQVWYAAPTEEELERQTEAVLSRFRACGQAEGALEELRGRTAFLSMLPGHHGLMGERFHPLLASRAADLLPVFQASPGPRAPTAVLSTRGGELVGFHPFDPALPAWNATVAGTTGSGKSFTVRTLLNGWLGAGGRVVVATRGRDYHRYAEIFGGTIYDVALDDQNLALGPFPPPAEVHDASTGASSDVTLAHLASIIAIMVTEGAEGVDREKRRLIHKATLGLYQSLAPDAPAPTFRDWLQCLLALRETERESAAVLSALARQMQFWLEGPYGPAFCRNRQQGASERLSVWNLERIHDSDTQGVVLGVLSGIIAQSIQTAPTIVVLDEVWAIFKSEAGAALVETLYRTVRKEGSAIWTISQSMNDYVALPDAVRSAILNNSPVKLFLAHDSSELDLVTNTFKLNPREAEMLGSLRSEPGRYSEILALLGKRRQVLRLVPTGIEYWLATSHPRDRDWEELAMREFPDLPRIELVKRLARRLPQGAINAQAIS